MTDEMTLVQYLEYQVIFLPLAICGALPAHYDHRAGKQYCMNVIVSRYGEWGEYTEEM